jgi:putative nucleotidyltransferase with HDIG domain
MNRQKALKHIKENVQQDNLINHMLATEAIMKKLAAKFGTSKEKWGLAGLVHDIDYEFTQDNPEKHSLMGAEMLADLGYNEDIIQAVKVHNDVHGLEQKTLMDTALYCSDPLTGLIVAAALISPEGTLSSINPEFVMNRFEDSSFAKGADRSQIKACQELDLELEEFIELGLKAMQEINDELGL